MRVRGESRPAVGRGLVRTVGRGLVRTVGRGLVRTVDRGLTSAYAASGLYAASQRAHNRPAWKQRSVRVVSCYAAHRR